MNPAKRLRYARTGLLTVLFLFLCSVLVAADRPNILLILADDLGFSDLGCYGGEIDTPAIDALAHNGLRFTNAYTSARCSPTRASLLTGLHPHQAGLPGLAGGNNHLKEYTVTIAEVLKDAGYNTFMVGKWHLGVSGPIQEGFDEFFGYVDGHSTDQWKADGYERLPKGHRAEIRPDGPFYATDAFNDYALEFVKQGQKKQAPWFVFLSHSSPHFPIQAPKKTIDKYYERYLDGWDVLRKQRFEKQKKIGLAKENWVLTERSLVPVDREDLTFGYSGKPNPAWDSLDEDRRRDLARRMATFAAMVDHIDQGVAKLVKHLENTGQLDNTLILFLSDNGACYEWGPFGFDGISRTGDCKLHTGQALGDIGQPGTHQAYGSAWANLGNTPFRLYKHFNHEGGLLTPMVVHWPAGLSKAGRWERTPVHVMDVMPTVCRITSARYPKTHKGEPILPAEGLSLLPLFKDGSLPLRSLGFEHAGAQALRKGKWKVVKGKRFPAPAEWELYNLADDPCETDNLAAKWPEKTATLVDEWNQWEKKVRIDGKK